MVRGRNLARLKISGIDISSSTQQPQRSLLTWTARIYLHAVDMFAGLDRGHMHVPMHHMHQLGDMGMQPHAPRQPTAWDRKFQLLQQYVREFGNTRVPENLDTARYPRLGVSLSALWNFDVAFAFSAWNAQQCRCIVLLFQLCWSSFCSRHGSKRSAVLAATSACELQARTKDPLALEPRTATLVASPNCK